MSDAIEFVRNYSDHSTDQGFQFEFCCDRCSNGYRTQFKASMLGRATTVLQAASGLLGGLLGNAADIGERARSATWQQARDKALVEAINEIKPNFIQCPRCRSWVCRKACWNKERGLCKECAPDLGVEMSAAQASRSVEEVWAHAKMSDADKKLAEGNWRETIVATCPECEAPLAENAKFCPECGHQLKTKTHCTECGAEQKPNVKFCSECGAKMS